jgi:RNase P subunit RPR2
MMLTNQEKQTSMKSNQQLSTVELTPQLKQNLQAICCPDCGYHGDELSFRLQAEDGFIIVECPECSKEFVLLNQQLMMIEVASLSIKQQLQVVLCPGCNHPQFSLRFRCDLRDDTCFFMVHCQTSGHLYRVIYQHQTIKLAKFV